MRLELETDDIGITVSVPGGYVPDVMNDMTNRLLDVYARAIAINKAYDEEPDG